MAIPGTCANTDISGIGIRVATYAQNFLSFIPAIYAVLDDGTVSGAELRFIEDQSTNMLLTAFGLLISAIVQAADSQGLDNYHAALVLNLSWMNNTNTFIYLLFHLHRAIWQRNVERWTWTSFWTMLRTRTLWLNPPTLVGSAHLVLMAGLGIWLWANPGGFGTSVKCQADPSLSIVGHNFFFDSGALRILSLIIYAVVAIPGINLAIPMFFLFSPYLVNLAIGVKLEQSPDDLEDRKRVRWDKEQRARWSSRCLIFGLLILLVINVIFLVDTELAISRNEFRQAGQDNIWSLGQVLALLLVVLPFKSLLMYLWHSTQLGALLGETKLKAAMDGLGKGPDEATESAIRHRRDGSWDGVRLWISRIGDTADQEKKSALHHAAMHGRMSVVELLIDNHALLDPADKDGCTPLYLALQHGQADVAALLAKNGADIEAKNREGETLLYLASFYGHIEVAKLLVELGADVNATEWDAKKPLHAASWNGHPDVARLLAENGADVNATERHGETPLHAASWSGHTDGAKLLVEKGADINAKNNDGETPLHAASINAHTGVAKLLVEKGADINTKSAYSLQLHRTSLSICAGWDGETPLHATSRNGHTDITKLLVEKGVDINAKDWHGETPLHVTSSNGLTVVAKLLVDNGADINAKSAYSTFSYTSLNICADRGGQTPLHAALLKGHTDVAELLVDNGVDPNF
ncbi:ankyrin repeat-containing domain protein [Mycena pura]|uniref:Ankyrin repeat-containing domain protein n=1 Tax=Mycena pura TaxID=153505 RepID=A0AAD6V961_9AGAR|nr:ankyrin repeat-containing domain protein [Mycena pura]